MREWLTRRTTVLLEADPSFVTGVEHGKKVTLTATVMCNLGSLPAGGQVNFRVHTGASAQNLGTRTLKNGKASVTTSALLKGMLWLIAEYPTQNVEGVEFIGDSNGMRYEVR